jgi:hypothetical protein
MIAFDASSIVTLNPDTNKFEGTPIPVGSELSVLFITRATTNSVVATLPTGDTPTGIAYNPSNRHIYVANTASNTVSLIHP